MEIWGSKQSLFLMVLIALISLVFIGCAPERSKRRVKEIEAEMYVADYSNKFRTLNFEIELDYDSTGKITNIDAVIDRYWGDQSYNEEIKFIYLDENVSEIEHEDEHSTRTVSFTNKNNAITEAEIAVKTLYGPNEYDLEVVYNNEGLLAEYEYNSGSDSPDLRLEGEFDYNNNNQVVNWELDVKTADLEVTLDFDYDSNTHLPVESEYKMTPLNPSSGLYPEAQVDCKFTFSENKLTKRKCDYSGWDTTDFWYDTEITYDAEGLISKIETNDANGSEIEFKYTYEEGDILGGSISPLGLGIPSSYSWGAVYMLNHNPFFDLRGQFFGNVATNTSGFMMHFTEFILNNI